MSFAIPSAFSWLALAVPVVLLYILKVRLRRMPVSTNMFWKAIYDEKPPRALWQQLRHWSSLLLQVLLLLLIILALADPFFSSRSRYAKRAVFVIDNSASMKSADVSPTRLEAAKSAALDSIEGLGVLDQAAIIVAGKRPSVVCGMSGHLPTLKEAVAAIQESDYSTDLKPAIELARRLIGDRLDVAAAISPSPSQGTIFVLTDGCLADSDASLLEPPKSAGATTPEIVPVYFGTKSSNIGITQFQARRSLSDPTAYEVLIKIQNASDLPARCRLGLTLNGGLIDVFPLKLSANEVWTHSVEKVSLDGGVLKAELSEFQSVLTPSTAETAEESAKARNDEASSGDVIADGLLADNVSHAVLPGRPVQKVLLVTEGSLFLQKVFEATPLVEVTVAKQLPEPLPSEFRSKNAVIVFHGRVPAQLPDANVFVIDPANDCELWTLKGKSDESLITEQDKTSPLLTFVSLQNVSLPKSQGIDFHTEVRPLVKTIAGDVLYADLNKSSGRCLLLAMSLEESDLAFRTAFPILISNALNWFSGVSAEFRPSLRPESVTALQLPSPEPLDFTANIGASKRDIAQLNGPGGFLRDVRVFRGHENSFLIGRNDADSVEVSVGPFPVAGLWTLSLPTSALEQPGKKTVPIAVNIADARESDLRPRSGAINESGIAAIHHEFGFSRPIWITLILLACTLTSVEWLLYHRRIIE